MNWYVHGLLGEFLGLICWIWGGSWDATLVGHMELEVLGFDMDGVDIRDG